MATSLTPAEIQARAKSKANAQLRKRAAALVAQAHARLLEAAAFMASADEAKAGALRDLASMVEGLELGE